MRAKLYTAINSLSANHDYLKTQYIIAPLYFSVYERGADLRAS